MNKGLKIIAYDTEIEKKRITYTIRLAWTTIEKDLSASMAPVSEGLGYNSITTMEIYLKNFENAAFDQINELAIVYTLSLSIISLNHSQTLLFPSI